MRKIVLVVFGFFGAAAFVFAMRAHQIKNLIQSEEFQNGLAQSSLGAPKAKSIGIAAAFFGKSLEINEDKVDEHGEKKSPKVRAVSYQLVGDSPEDRFKKRYQNAKLIMKEETRTPASGGLERIRLFKTDFKYPLIRVVERIQTDRNGNEGARVWQEMVADHVLLRRNPNMTESDFQAALSRHQVKVRRNLPHSDVYVVEFDATKKIDKFDEVIRDLKDEPWVANVEPDYLVSAR